LFLRVLRILLIIPLNFKTSSVMAFPHLVFGCCPSDLLGFYVYV
jgi:hypothetical protein